MTWVVGATPFNGLVGVADVQATFEYLDKSRPPKYYNCVRKLHHVYDNLYIGFSGDIRSGLQIIERLTAQMRETFNPGELFDIEGQLSALQGHLKFLYDEINKGASPNLELMFLWTKQEGESPIYEPACMRFIAPHFGINGIGMLQINQAGSGKRSAEFQALVDFLTGKAPKEDLHQKFFPNTPSAPSIWTASKIRTLLVAEGRNISYSGVSKTFLSVVAELGWNRTVSVETHVRLTSQLKEIGVEFRQEKTLSDILNIVEIDPVKIDERIKELIATSPEKLLQVSKALRAFKEEENFEPLCELPKFEEQLHPGGDENVELSALCATWAEMEVFMRRNRIYIGQCTAVA